MQPGSVSFKFYQPTQIVFGEGVFNELGDYVAGFGRRCLLVTGRYFALKYGYVDKIKDMLGRHGIDAAHFGLVEPNPSYETVKKGVKVACNFDIDFVVAFGGGSVIDAGKAIALLATLGGDVEDYLYPKTVDGYEIMPVVAVPTTCGTGSEVTKYSLLTDVKAGKKRVIAGSSIIPRLSVLDPDLLETLPSEMVAYTGFDALSHALESYFSCSSTLISDMFAVESIKTALRSLENAYRGDRRAKARMLYASMLAGMAINITGTILVHALGYPLTTKYGVHHGLANAVFLAEVLKYILPTVKGRAEELCSELGFSNWRELVERIVILQDKVGVPSRLSSLGIKAFPEEIAREALSYSRNIENSPVKPGLEELVEICRRAL